MDALDAYGEWAAELDLSDVPDDVVRLAEIQVAGQVAAAEAGSEVHARDGDDAYSRAFRRAAASCSQDYDDYLFAGHTGHSAVWASVEACRERELDGAALLESVVVANELEGRLGAAATVGPHNGQMWAFLHAAGAAAVLARLDGDAEAVADAVRLALYSPEHPFDAGFMDGHAKDYTAAAPTARGMRLGEA
ncbi:MAG: hypothetical protein ACOCT0_05315, partial [Halobacteriota archaeon]